MAQAAKFVAAERDSFVLERWVACLLALGDACPDVFHQAVQVKRLWLVEQMLTGVPNVANTYSSIKRRQTNLLIPRPLERALR